MKLHYKKFGEGEPLFILHGLFGSSDNWMTIAKQLAQSYEVILVDLRNHGESPHSDQWNYPVMAQDIYQLAQLLGYKNINLIGHSMGGKIGMTIAGNYPGLLKKRLIFSLV